VHKHSTGGVVDETSLIAAPLVAAGVVIPMMSGRAGPLIVEEFRVQLQTHGLALIGQSEELAPADA
jgi:pyrimidine-nucleoside phosphorylase